MAQTGVSQLATIIVTASRRVENLRDVAVSAEILNQDCIGALFCDAADIIALTSLLPGLNVERSNGRVAPRFPIRGFGKTDFYLAASQPVSVLLDDVVMEIVTLKSFPVFDVTIVGFTSPCPSPSITPMRQTPKHLRAVHHDRSDPQYRRCHPRALINPNPSPKPHRGRIADWLCR